MKTRLKSQLKNDTNFMNQIYRHLQFLTIHKVTHCLYFLTLFIITSIKVKRCETEQAQKTR